MIRGRGWKHQARGNAIERLHDRLHDPSRRGLCRKASSTKRNRTLKRMPSVCARDIWKRTHVHAGAFESIDLAPRKTPFFRPSNYSFSERASEKPNTEKINRPTIAREAVLKSKRERKQCKDWYLNTHNDCNVYTIGIILVDTKTKHTLRNGTSSTKYEQNRLRGELRIIGID